MPRFSPNTPVTLLGSVTLDTNITPSAQYRKVGGSVMYSGITFRKLGVRASVVTSVADRDRSVLSVFDGIPVCAVRAEHTTEFVNVTDGDNRTQRMPHAGRTISRHFAPEAVAAAKVLYLGPLFPADIDLDVINFIAASGVPAVVDLQGYLREVIEGVVVARGHVEVNRVLSVCYRAKVGHQELHILEDHLGMKAPQIVARYTLEELVATAGRGGGRVYSASGEQTDYAAVIPQVEVDTTGAGDVFFAAYCAARDWRGLGVAEACHEAACVAGAHVAGEFVRTVSR